MWIFLFIVASFFFIQIAHFLDVRNARKKGEDRKTNHIVVSIMYAVAVSVFIYLTPYNNKKPLYDFMQELMSWLFWVVIIGIGLAVLFKFLSGGKERERKRNEEIQRMLDAQIGITGTAEERAEIKKQNEIKNQIRKEQKAYEKQQQLKRERQQQEIREQAERKRKADQKREALQQQIREREYQEKINILESIQQKNSQLEEDIKFLKPIITQLSIFDDDFLEQQPKILNFINKSIKDGKS